jgi:hypothetical protein
MRFKPTTLRGYVAYHPLQGLRLDMAARTEKHVWDQLTEPDELDEEFHGPSMPPISRAEMQDFGWKVLRCTVIAEPQEED